MERCANTEALNRYQDELERSEARYNRALREFRDSMDCAIDNLVGVFNSNAIMYDIDRSELREILLDDILEQL